MKKTILALACALASLSTFAQDKVTVNAGFQFPSTMNATIGYERPLTYGSAVEIYGELGNHWQEDNDSVSGNFWKGYYWDGGIVYKHRLVRFKNGMLRFRFGPQFGAVQREFFFGVEGSFEYSYVCKNGWEFTLTQKNNVNFIHGDTFRNGLTIGIKVPL